MPIRNAECAITIVIVFISETIRISQGAAIIATKKSTVRQIDATFLSLYCCAFNIQFQAPFSPYLQSFAISCEVRFAYLGPYDVSPLHHCAIATKNSDYLPPISIHQNLVCGSDSCATHYNREQDSAGMISVAESKKQLMKKKVAK